MAPQLGEPFDETAALAELERLRDSITAARRAREQKSDEFDAFIESFRKPAATPVQNAGAATARDAPSPAAAVSPNIETTVAPVTQHPPIASSQRSRYSPRIVGASALVAAIALGWLIYRSQTPSPSSPRPANPAASTPVTPAATKAPEPTNVPASPQAVVVRLRTLRPVWMRVVVDGRKTHEGTVGGGEQLQFGGDRSIAVRVGNGGDVVVNSDGREDPFGSAGLPVTRTFSRQ